MGCSSGRLPSTTIRIEPEGVALGGIHLADKILRDRLLAQTANYGSCPVVLLASAECSFGRIQQTLDILGSAGVWDVRFALASATNKEVRFTPIPVESVHVPWREFAALISGNEVSMTTNSDEAAKWCQIWSCLRILQPFHGA